MTQVAVGLWQRNTHDYTIPVEDTLAVLQTAVATTQQYATSRKGLTAIFVAPEFLFTKQRDSHAGTTAIQRGERDVVLTEVEQISRDYPGTLLIPGTIVFRESFTQAFLGGRFIKAKDNLGWAKGTDERKPFPTYETDVDDRNEKGYSNFYDRQIEELSNVEKQLCGSGFPEGFFIKNRTYVFFGGKKIFSYGKQTNMNDYQDDEKRGIFVPGKRDGVKDIEGLKVGFEICLDHSIGMLREHIKKRELDLHIICSAEVPNESSHCMAKQGGYLLHASTGAGSKNHTGVFKVVEKSSEAQKVVVNEGLKARMAALREKLGGGGPSKPLTMDKALELEELKASIIPLGSGNLQVYNIELPV